LPAAQRSPAAAFGGNNGRIAFQSMRHGNWEIYTMNADGSNVVRLTTEAAEDERPGWSPDSTKLVFGSRRGGNADIYTMNADGSGLQRLTTHPGDDYAPQWSADGTKIVFRSSRDGNSEIYTMNANGSNQTNLTNNPANDSGPVWSPLGNKIAFSSNRAGNANVYTMNTDGGGVTQLTDNPATDFGASFSPDGARMAFRSERDGNVEVYVMNADGSGQTNLTHHPADDRGPAWSPDGTLIIFYTDRDGNYELYTIRPDGSDPRRLTNNAADDYSPDWGVGQGTPPPTMLPILLSAAAPGTVDGLAFDAADVLRYEPQSDAWSLHFDASDVGLGGNVSGLATDGNALLLAFKANTTVPGVGPVTPRDVVRFQPTSLGATTAGTFSLFFRGATWGLTTTGEKLDALGRAPDGRLLLSTMGAFKVPGLTAKDDDLLAFQSTAPNWSKFRALYSLLRAKDLDSVWFDGGNGDIYIALGTAFSLSGAAGSTAQGDARDIVRLRPAGGNGYNVLLVWDGSAAGLPVALDAFELVD
jgi:TolB protein